MKSPQVANKSHCDQSPSTVKFDVVVKIWRHRCIHPLKTNLLERRHIGTSGYNEIFHLWVHRIWLWWCQNDTGPKLETKLSTVVFSLHSAAGRHEMKKTSQGFWMVRQEWPWWELWNEPPLDRSGLTPQIPFMASLWIRSGYDMKVEVSAETYQVGAHFKALIKAILVAPLKSFERFFRISSSPAGLC